MSGTEVIPAQFDLAFVFSEGLAAVSIEDRNGYVDRSGNIIIPLIYEEANAFEKGRAFIRYNDVNFYIDKNGNCVETTAFPCPK